MKIFHTKDGFYFCNIAEDSMGKMTPINAYFHRDYNLAKSSSQKKTELLAMAREIFFSIFDSVILM